MRASVRLRLRNAALRGVRQETPNTSQMGKGPPNGDLSGGPQTTRRLGWGTHAGRPAQGRSTRSPGRGRYAWRPPQTAIGLEGFLSDVRQLLVTMVGRTFVVPDGVLARIAVG